jgi:hypothetical protein
MAPKRTGGAASGQARSGIRRADKHNSVQQAHAASFPRPSARHPNKKPMDNSGGYHVNPHPCRFSGFTFDKAIKLQCIGDQYLPVAPDSAESDYLIKLAAEAFQLGKCVIDDAGFTAQLIMEAVLQQIGVLGPAQVFRVHYVNFGQLQPVRGAPNIAERPPPKDGPSYVPAERFEEYTATETREKRGPGGETVSHDVNYVQAPVAEVRGGSGSPVSNSHTALCHLLLALVPARKRHVTPPPRLVPPPRPRIPRGPHLVSLAPHRPVTTPFARLQSAYSTRWKLCARARRAGTTTRSRTCAPGRGPCSSA